MDIIKFKFRKTLRSKFKNVSNSIIMDKKMRNDYEDLDGVAYTNNNFVNNEKIRTISNAQTDVVVPTRSPVTNNTSAPQHNSNSNETNPLGIMTFNASSNANFPAIYQQQQLHSASSSQPSINISQSIPILSSISMNHLDGKTFSLRTNLWLCLFVVFYSFYLVLGSLIFAAIETPIVNHIHTTIATQKADFMKRYPMIEDDDLEDFLAAVVKANDRGISPLRNVSNELNWGFGQSLFFSSTIVTTIGYGHVTPLSQTGKIFCIIYASFGIPLTLVLLTAIIERLLIPANWLLGKLNSSLGHLYQPFNIRLLHLTIIVMIVAIIFVALPTLIFSYLEPEWGTLDALYYCFITLTTIGLGDYIPGEGVDPDSRSLYKICIAIYLICGLIAVMLCLTVFYDIPQLNLGQLFTENGTGETEKLRLSGNAAPCYSGPSGLFISQQDDERRAVVRIRPHGGDESPSPTDDQPASSVGNQSDIRVP